MGSLDRTINQPVAVVRRRGEDAVQERMRLSGATDEETGYTGVQYRGRHGNSVSLAYRRAQLDAQQSRADATQARFEDRLALGQQGQALKERELALHERIQQHAEDDAKSIQDQASGFLGSLERIAQDPASPRGSKGFVAKALAIAGQYPAAIAHVPRLAEMVKGFETDAQKQNIHPDVINMLSELGQIDPSRPGIDAYLRTLPGKYVGALGNKEVMNIFNATQKLVGATQPLKAPEGMEKKSQTLTGPGGTLTVQPQGTQEQKVTAANARFLQNQLANNQRLLNAVAEKRAALKPPGSDATEAQKNAYADSAKLLDDIKATHASTIADVQSQIAQLQPNVAPEAASDLPPAPAPVNGGTATPSGDMAPLGTPSANAAPNPHQAAIAWAAANPDDPRSAAINAIHGIGPAPSFRSDASALTEDMRQQLAGK